MFAKPNYLEMEEVSEHNADKMLTFGRQSSRKKRVIIMIAVTAVVLIIAGALLAYFSSYEEIK